MKAQNVPLQLWDFCCKWSCAVQNCTASNSFLIEGRTQYEIVHGHTPDIFSLSEYDLYEPVYYCDPGDFPSPKLHIGRWLGEAVNIGQAMTYYILPPLGIPIVCSTVQPIPQEEKARDEV
jgi:hypothetical protein